MAGQGVSAWNSDARPVKRCRKNIRTRDGPLPTRRGRVYARDSTELIEVRPASLPALRAGIRGGAGYRCASACGRGGSWEALTTEMEQHDRAQKTGPPDLRSGGPVESACPP